jgi:sigma-B regulation protein RsbU (phosphoserine phosphatase)
LNTDRKQVVFARAGHPYPVLISPGAEPRQLKSPGNLLGVFDQVGCEHGAVQLRRSDKVLIYSDGLEQFIGGFDESARFGFSGEFKRISVLPVGRMFEEIESLVLGRTGGAGAEDDITAVCLEVL